MARLRMAKSSAVRFEWRSTGGRTRIARRRLLDFPSPRSLPFPWLLVAALSPWVIWALLRFHFPNESHRLDLCWDLAGLFIGLTGVLLRGWTIGRLARLPFPPAADSTGYEVARHPLQVINFMIVFGLLLMFHQWWLLVIGAGLYALVASRRLVLDELFLIPNRAFPRRLRPVNALDAMDRDWRSSLRREIPALLAVLCTYSAVEIIGHYVATGGVEFDPIWWICITCGFALCAALYLWPTPHNPRPAMRALNFRSLLHPIRAANGRLDRFTVCVSAVVAVSGLVAAILFSSSITTKEVVRAASVAGNGERVTLFAFGDWGTGSAAQQRVAAAMKSEAQLDGYALNAILSLGDNFYLDLQNVSDPKWDSLFEAMYDKNSLNAPFYAALGNHDYGGQKDLIELSYGASHPQSRWRMPARWYRMQIPESNPMITLLVLDSNVDELPPEMWEAQNRWLAQQLQEPRTTPWLVVAAHHPLHSSGQHGVDERVAAAWLPLITAANVDFYLSGHEHNLEHFQRGTGAPDYLICGGGGATLRDVSPGASSSFQLKSYGFLSFRFGEHSADVSFIDDKGDVVHSFSRLAAKH